MADKVFHDKYYARFDEAGHWQFLSEHLCHTAAYCRQFLEPIGFGTTGELLGLLHDLGKYAPEFQYYLLSSGGRLKSGDAHFIANAAAMRGKIPHAGAGARWLLNQKGLPCSIRSMLAMAIATHHDALWDFIAPSGESEFRHRLIDSPYKYEPVQAIYDRAEQSIRERLQQLMSGQEISGEFRHYESGWKGMTSPELIDFNLGMLLKHFRSALLDADQLDAAGRQPQSRVDWTALLTVFEGKLTAFSRPDMPLIDRYRADVSSECRESGLRFDKGTYRLTVPTGGGKTFSSLRFAMHHARKQKLSRIFYFLPFTSIIEQNAKEVRHCLDQDDGISEIVLEHHCNLLPERKEEECYKRISENFDAPIVYTTLVQFLNAVFTNDKRANRKLHRFADAVLIFDEIQSLPIPMLHIFNAALNYLAQACGSTIVLSSATQPQLDRIPKEFGALNLSIPPELVVDPAEKFRQLKRVTVEYVDGFASRKSAELADFALQQVREYGSTLLIVNTKSHARKLFEYANESGIQTYHLSTNMCPAHRSAVLDEIRMKLSDKQPILVISTALIEAGVNISFRCVIRMMAGLDALAQAAGRCNRHQEDAIGRVFLLDNPQGLALPSSISCAQEATRYALQNFLKNPEYYEHDLLSPRLLDKYYEQYYHQNINQLLMHYPVSWDGKPGYSLRDWLMGNCAASSACHESTAKNMHPRGAYGSAGNLFRAIDDYASDAVVVPYTQTGKDLIAALSSTDPRNYKTYNKLLAQTQQYSVNLTVSSQRKLSLAGGFYQLPSGVLILSETHYRPDIGLDTGENNELDFLCI